MPANRAATPPAVAPYLTVPDANAALDFYARAFGAVEEGRMATPDGAKIMHAAMTINGGLIMLADDMPEMMDGQASTPEAFGGSPVTIHLNVPDVDTTFKKAVDAGATITMPVEDQFWGDRYGQITDPFGHRWSLATTIKTLSDEEIQIAMEKAFAQQS